MRNTTKLKNPSTSLKLPAEAPPRSRKRGALLLTALLVLLSVPTFLYLNITRIVPSALRYYLEQSGGSLKSCQVSSPARGEFHTPSCVLVFSTGTEQTELNLENASFTFSSLRQQPDIRIENLRVKIPKNSRKPKGSGTPSIPRLYFGKLEIQKLQLEISDIRIFARSTLLIHSAEETRIRFELEPIPPVPPLLLPLGPFHVEGSIRGQQIEAEATSADPLLPGLELSFQHDLTNAVGEIALKRSSIPLPPLKNVNAVLANAPDISFEQGTISASGRIRWAAGEMLQDSSLKLHLNGVSGKYEEIYVKNVNSELELRLSPSVQIHSISPLRIESVLLGPVLRNIELKFLAKKNSDQTSQLELKDFYAESFGGSLRVSELMYSANKDSKFELKVDAIDLGSLLEMTGKRVEGSGKLSGSIPFSLSEGKLSVQEGMLSSLPPGGTLRYLQESSNDELNPNLKLAFDALEQFEYEDLKARIQYSAHGDMTADIALRGKNPHLFKGRQIDFNISVQENIPALLRSIRLTTQAGPDIWRDRK